MNNEAPIAFRRVYVDLTGGSVNAALMLSQAIYWSKITDDPDGWVYKTADDWYDEIGLKRRQQMTAREHLAKCEWWQEDRGGPRGTVRYRVDLNGLKAAIQSARNVHSDNNQNARNVHPESVQNEQNVQSDDVQNARNVHSEGSQNARNVQSTSRETHILNESDRAKRTSHIARNVHSPYTETTTETTTSETTTEKHQHQHPRDGDGGDGRHPADAQTAKAIAAWRSADFEPPAERMHTTISRWTQQYGVNDVLAAIETAMLSKAKKPGRYVERVLENRKRERNQLARDQEIMEQIPEVDFGLLPESEQEEPVSEQEALWAGVLMELEQSIPAQVFDQWVRDMTLLSSDNDVFVIGLQNARAIDWMENRFSGLLQRTLASLVSRPVQVKFEALCEVTK